MTAINFSPLMNPQGAECSICRNTAENNDWVFHEEATSLQDQKVQHAFHKSCIKEWLKTPEDPRSCPVCRKEVNVLSVLEEDEIEGYQENENRKGTEWANNINSACKTSALVASICTSNVIIIEDMIQKDWGWQIKGNSTALIHTIFMSFIAAKAPTSLIIKTIFFTNAAFSTALISALDIINPLNIPTIGLDNSNVLVTVTYAIATLILTRYFLPAHVTFLPGNEDERPVRKYFIWSGLPTIILGGLFARSAWKYFTGSV